METMTVLFIAAFAALLASLLLKRERPARLAVAITGIFAAIYGWSAHGLFGVVVPTLVALVALAQALGGAMSDRRTKLSDDERALHEGPLGGLGKRDMRRFLDQGLWLTGKAGDVLTREGDQVAYLYWLSAGEAEVSAGGRTVARCGPRQLIGEATVLSPDAATATVMLTRDSRFWAAPAKALHDFLAANPAIGRALEHGFNVSLKEKLDAMNRARA